MFERFKVLLVEILFSVGVALIATALFGWALDRRTSEESSNNAMARTGPTAGTKLDGRGNGYKSRISGRASVSPGKSRRYRQRKPTELR
jgi:hypothetical protein